MIMPDGPPENELRTEAEKKGGDEYLIRPRQLSKVEKEMKKREFKDDIRTKKDALWQPKEGSTRGR